MTDSRHITIYTILGSLPFISKLHIKSIKDCADKDITIVAFGGRSKESDIEFENLFKELGLNFKLFRRSEYPFNTNCIDGNYDFLINKVKPKDLFITMHDDCILGKDSNIFSLVRKKLEIYDFCGKLENNIDMKEICQKLNIQNISKYKDLIIDGKNMHDIRLGTWFLSGKYNSYKQNQLSFGDDIRIYKFLSNILLNNFRYKLKVPFLKLDGGFNFNLKIHKKNIRYSILEDDIKIKHLVHATNFFVKKGFYDGLGELSQWEARWHSLKKKKKLREIKQEKIFLKFLNEKLNSIEQPYEDLIKLVERI